LIGTWSGNTEEVMSYGVLAVRHLPQSTNDSFLDAASGFGWILLQNSAAFAGGLACEFLVVGLSRSPI
jgi:hypothetical protein